MKIVATPENVFTLLLDDKPHMFRVVEHWRGLSRLTSQYDGAPVEMIVQIESNVGQKIANAVCGNPATQNMFVVSVTPNLIAALMRAQPSTTKSEAVTG